MKILLVSQRLISNTEYPEIREGLDLRWGRFLNACRIPFIAASYEVPVDSYFRQYDVLGVLLTGGNDLAALNKNPANEKRDCYEEEMAHKCEEYNLPILGVCRGMQFLAFRAGGTLKKGLGHVSVDHPVKIASSTLFSEFYRENIDVNSYHNYVITEVPNRFKLAAHSLGDSTIEAFEDSGSKQSGIMWHPERCDPFRKEDIDFFRSFFQHQSEGSTQGHGE